jgi:hypothetical protein
MVGSVAKATVMRQAIGVVAAVSAGVALWRFTSGDWLGGVVFAGFVGSLSLWYWLVARGPRDTRRY